MSLASARAHRIKAHALEAGFDLAGIAPAAPPDETARLAQWVAEGFAGTMRYLTEQVDIRADVRAVLPWAKSVLCVGLQYDTPFPYSLSSREGGWIARYAWGTDYHDVMGALLGRLESALQRTDGPCRSQCWVDAAPMIEKAYAARAGMGWWGRNTCLLHPTHGSWFFLGEIVTDLELEPDQPLPDRCGTCRACLDVCPTQALVAPYVLDARRCISYVTIERRGTLPEKDRLAIGRHVFGCDLCQDVCPWNRRRLHQGVAAFEPRSGWLAPDLVALARSAQDAFSVHFQGSALRRARRRGILRNVAVALAQVPTAGRLDALHRLARDEDAVVREHAAWALSRLRISEESGTP
jgi:epoxyqueuosine reductase